MFNHYPQGLGLVEYPKVPIHLRVTLSLFGLELIRKDSVLLHQAPSFNYGVPDGCLLVPIELGFLDFDVSK